MLMTAGTKKGIRKENRAAQVTLNKMSDASGTVSPRDSPPSVGTEAPSSVQRVLSFTVP